MSIEMETEINISQTETHSHMSKLIYKTFIQSFFRLNNLPE